MGVSSMIPSKVYSAIIPQREDNERYKSENYPNVKETACRAPILKEGAYRVNN